MIKNFRTILTLLLLVVGTTLSWAEFRNFAAILNNQAGTLLTSEEQVEGTAVSFGVAVDESGTVTRVDAGDASAVATISGKYHSDHGMTNLSVVVPVDGGVVITVGQCTYSGNDIVVKNSESTVVAQKTPTKACWKNDNTNVTEVYYTGEATTLTISGMSYCPYIAVAKNESTVAKYDIAFSVGESGAEGTVPASTTWIEGDSYAIPVNYTLYKEGYTLTGWTDGTNTFAAGETYTPSADVTLTPVFSQNTVALADRTDAVTLKWNFRRDQGAPTLAYERKTGFLVTQASVNGETIDVKMDFNTTSGKLNNTNNTDWAQVNNGTTFTIPSCKGATVSTEAYSTITTTTIDGQTDYTQGTSITYTVASSNATIDVVIGDGDYYRFIQTILPVEESESAGGSFDNADATVVFAMNDKDNAGAYTVTPDAESFATIAFDPGTATISGTKEITKTDGTASGVTGIQFAPATGASDVLTWTVRPAVGLTFTPNRVSGYINRDGTDVELGVTVTAQKTDGELIKLGTYTAWRQSKASSSKAYDATAVYQYDITLTAEQQAALAGSEGFNLMATIGVASGKKGIFGQVTISGKLNGEMATVNKYAVAVAASPAEGGTATIYPSQEKYTEGDEVQLTASEKFGYDFINWTNAAGEVVSSEAKFTYTVAADETLTANFKKVETYALDITIEGAGKDYMVSLSPEPTIVDGKNMYEAGATVVVTASSNKIITFTNWNNGETASEQTVNMDGNKSLTASFSAIDYIVAWDFYQAGCDGRTADFAAADNDAVTLIMRNAEGTTSKWLDKSQVAAGGYEGAPAAVSWVVGSTEGDVGNYYWQTCVNASAFTNIKVITSMLYNYNAYTTQLVEYSLDGEEWTEVGKIELTGAKNWTPGEFTLPEAANNKEKVYIRWISDKTSTVAGTSSKNDGIALGATYIIGDAAIINDGTAPVLVSSVPADKGERASANGKIVLTFDEKVMLTEAASATLGETNLTPTVSGKTVICEYKGLAYSTSYTFTIKAGSVADLAGNANAEDIVINFTTKVKPTVSKGVYDFIVPIDGNITQALAAANARGVNATERYRILVLNGSYTFDTNGTTTGGDGNIYDDPRSYLTAPYVSIIGESLEGVTITNFTPEATWNNGYGDACPLEGIGNGDVLIINKTGHDAYFQGLTFKSSMGDAHGRDIVINDQSNRTIFKDARLWGYQDTYVSNSDAGKFYFEGGVLRGRTDYLCGKGDVFYNEVTLQQCGTGGYIAVPSKPKNYGYVFMNCYIKKETSDVTFYLGRPWGQGTPKASFINTKMDVNAIGDGWDDMSGGWPDRFAEYNSYLTSGTTIDLSGRRTSWTDKESVAHTNNPILTAEEAASMSLGNVMGQDDDWDPTALTEQASAPTGAQFNDDKTAISWAENDYVLCWVVSKNGVFAGVTTENTFAIDDATATWTVRAANEMGGLGEAAEVGKKLAVDQINVDFNAANSPVYNLAGQRVGKGARGILIQNGKLFLNK